MNIKKSDIPLFINGVAVGWLFTSTSMNVEHWIFWGIAGITLVWYGNINKK
jgi:hypothetical protein